MPSSEALVRLPISRGIGDTFPIDTDCHNGYTTVQQGHRREGVCLRRLHLKESWMAEEVPIG